MSDSSRTELTGSKANIQIVGLGLLLGNVLDGFLKDVIEAVLFCIGEVISRRQGHGSRQGNNLVIHGGTAHSWRSPTRLRTVIVGGCCFQLL